MTALEIIPKKFVPLFKDLLIDSFGKFLLTELVLTNKIRPSDFSDTNNESARPITGGVSKTIKDGIIFDARKLLKDVKKIVDEEKRNTPGWEKLLFENIQRK